MDADDVRRAGAQGITFVGTRQWPIFSFVC